MRRVLALLAILLLAPTAQAQTPTAALSAQGISPSYAAARDTQLITFNLTMTVSNVVCTSSVPLRVSLNALVRQPPAAAANESANRTFLAQASPPELTYTIPQGAYGTNPALPAARPFMSRQPATFAVAARNLTNASSVEVAYKAAFAGYTGADCRGNAGIPAAAAEGTFQVHFAPNVPPAPPPTPQMPLPAFAIWIALGVAILLTRRRPA